SPSAGTPGSETRRRSTPSKSNPATGHWTLVQDDFKVISTFTLNIGDLRSVHFAADGWTQHESSLEVRDPRKKRHNSFGSNRTLSTRYWLNAVGCMKIEDTFPGSR